MPTRDFSIRSKLIGAFSILLLFLGAVGLTGFYGATRIDSALVEIEANWLPSIKKAGEIDALTGRYTTSLLRHILSSDPKTMAVVDKDIAERGQKIDRAAKDYEFLISSPEERGFYQAFMQDWQAFTKAAEPILVLSRAGEKAKALALYEAEGVPPRRRASLALEKIIALNDAGAASAETESRAIYTQTRTLIVATSLGALALSLALAGLLIRGIGRGIGAVVTPMTALAADDLSVQIPHQGARTEIGRIADAVQVFKTRLIRMKALEEETALARAGAEAQRK
ncbi:MCP four helix bundle domain-containing protein, partial [Methylobacterium organophilum]|uniref:MCP four helix bundle domain-containing protein n=1 Tax=Methylobacterium organophilum TaxID=410 RepID=UPI001EE33E2D